MCSSDLCLCILFIFFSSFFFFFFFNDTATTEIYTLSLHDALPISALLGLLCHFVIAYGAATVFFCGEPRNSFFDTECRRDRKSTRLNSSHLVISYAVFCLKKKKLRAYLF